MFNLNKGLLTPDLVQDFESLVFSNEEKFVLSWLSSVTKKLRVLKVFVFGLYSLNSFVAILVFVLADKIQNFSRVQIWILFAIYIFFTVLTYVVNVLGSARLMNIYTRIISTVFGNILQSIYDIYTVSLAHLIAKFPAPKTFSTRLSAGALSANNYQASLAQIIGVFFGMFFSALYGFVNDDFVSLAIFVFGSLLIVLYVFFMYLGRRYVVSEDNLSRYSDSLDRLYNDRKSLLFSNRGLIDRSEFKTNILESVAFTTYINFTTYFVKLIVPVILVFSPFIFGDTNDLYVLVAAGLFITMKVFSQTTAASNYNVMAVSAVKVQQLEDLYKTIKDVGAELTPEKYEEKKYVYKRNLNISENKKLFDGYVISKLSFIAGRGDKKRTIGIEKLNLASGLVHFLYGRSGAGKSIFGRLLTLRYADFQAEKLVIKNIDIRTYQTLQDGLSELHFSSLRHVTTSYRNAIGIYLTEKTSLEGLLDFISSLKITSRSVRDYFTKHSKYYTEMDVSGFNWEVAWQKLKNLNNDDLLRISRIIRNSDWGKVDNKILDVIALLEYSSFHYLKVFIPDSTLYFTDAILSEPPISQGQRRRVILALDLLVKGKLFVADEPFANLDDKSSGNVLRLLDDYAKRNNAVVLVLDQKKRVTEFKKFENGKVLKIVESRIVEV